MRPMTIGALSRRTGVPVKTLRHYEDLGLIYTVGRSPGNYRLFDDEALWCAQVVTELRDLGLTLAELQDLARGYLTDTSEPIGPTLAQVLERVRARTRDSIAELEARLARLDAFEAENQAELTGQATFREHDPRFRTDES